ncbi:nickel pincer cofactor biosynthesis protein LarB [uncultured Paracoccus sp.]|uniref:nickel pincer cofactor biosynthesis protein LarB n=1 Tax=uncultured Paracoccus sp. TaxID=189685 RepID=UPI002606F68F|nr:nickel pincer cofactor biosynthesis protein LarB [uncultured Paracoccus sp.]
MTTDPGDIRFDWQRRARTGIPEAVLAEGKSPDQLARILKEARERDAALLLTRLAPEVAANLGDLDYDPVSRTAILGTPTRRPESDGKIAVVCAGSSDLPVAAEARRALQVFGTEAPLYADVGVAGLWRLMEVADELRQFRVVIAVAGMEGALFSVLAGLVPGLVIAVPSPVGYGVSAGGQAALSAALASCAPGVVTTNIGNGFGAAAAAWKAIGAG